ncbi:deoxynucleoside triphosphate triphosphohydrolase SAMHD1 [Adelges cooleyi]|uniref:deoxynucleoside triphosphate triphosphohydrolase SAMHD1 n=1 Tax=Adelges cooleyi TaxID=133065 RepID=UPI0021804E16|nr:deoxynucleoside triphosphate triphosphohydrolase SAMHD1 [Adelges cooleyi]XP_050434425.1 deoxynucleoside triphosphate triphosphohydrolase SAMHD1 [Adelges cooleyi]XP_050434426.1 deoxynucleoside triphosphate triphosphohydrolase SAMHD1 [Adelges cooleyi]
MPTKEINGSEKVFNDNVHGHINLHPLCVKIIDTPEFQRLRNIKQLGTCYLVYPCASINRFEHSLGVCHLAGEMVNALYKNSEQDIGITNEEKLCVQLAGLCHDLGHGPFSHTWERYLKAAGISWKHEDCSIQMIKHIIKKNVLEEEFNKYGLNLNYHLDLICELINGEGTTLPKNKHFLYQIISNKDNGIDVDKWDYFLRDGKSLNLNISFDYKRLIQFSRVVVDPNSNPSRKVIAFRNKEARNVYDMYRVRSDLHTRAYQHRVVKNTELMLVDILLMADKYITVQTPCGKKYSLKEVHTNIEAMSRLTDHILYEIEYSLDPNLITAQNLLKNLQNRNLYKFVGSYNLNVINQENCDQLDVEKLKADLKKSLQDKFGIQFGISATWLDCGAPVNNPLKHVIFFKRPLCDSTTVVLDKTPYDKYYPLQKLEFFKREISVFSKQMNLSHDKLKEIDAYTEEYFNKQLQK